MTGWKLPPPSVGVLGVCLAIGVALAAIALVSLGLTLWTALLAAMLLVCPLVVGWGVFATLRRRPGAPAGNKHPPRAQETRHARS